uniref:PH domain-containing protein n=1 Tax=Haemonchus contortus TaxID=6289 RepID=A0A7I4YQZ3_HAECO
MPSKEAGAEAPAPNTKVHVNPAKQKGGTPPESSSVRSKFSPYRSDLEEKFRETLEKMRSKSFDDFIYLPDEIPTARIFGTVQCCFKKKRRFFRRTGRIRRLRICITKKDNLIIYRKRSKGLILPLSAVTKTSVSTQAFFVSEEKRLMICRYRMVFDIGTVNLFFANESIPPWRDAFDEIIDKYSRSQFTLPIEQPAPTAKSSSKSTDDKVSAKSDSKRSCSTVSCEDRSDRHERSSKISHRSLGTPVTIQSTASSCQEQSGKTPSKSVRRGKRSVASLRACLHRRFCGHSVTKAVQTEEKQELHVSVSNPEQDRLVPPMRKGMYGDDVEPPLPVNPPPMLHYCSPYKLDNSQMTITAPSSIKENLAVPALSRSSRSCSSIHVTISESAEIHSDTQAITVRKVVSSEAITKPIETSTPKCMACPAFEPVSMTPRKPLRVSPGPVEHRLSKSGIVQHRQKRPSTAATMVPEKFDYKVMTTKETGVTQADRPPSRYRESVRFSISSFPSVGESSYNSWISASTQSMRLEDMSAEDTQHSDYADVPDSLVAAQDDEDWWQHSHAA